MIVETEIPWLSPAPITRASFRNHSERARAYRGKLTTNEMTVMASSVAQNQSHCEGSESGSI
jgi:hypothetical protein